MYTGEGDYTKVLFDILIYIVLYWINLIINKKG